MVFFFFILRHLWVVYDEVTIVFIYCFLEDDKDLLSAILIRLRQDMEIVLTFFYDFFTIFLQDDDDLAERALDGLRQVMMVKSYVVLPYLIPQVKIHLHIQI